MKTITDRILILDDKPLHEDLSTFELISRLNSEQRSFIDHYSTVKNLWSVETNRERITLLADFSKYSHVFIHDSFDEITFDDVIKPLVLEQISKATTVVLFSGSKQDSGMPLKIEFDNQIFPGVYVYEILRRNYHKGFENFLNSKILLGAFDLRYLYNSELSPRRAKARHLFETIRRRMENSLETAINSKEFRELLLLNHEENQIPSILENCSKMNDDEYLEAIEQYIKDI